MLARARADADAFREQSRAERERAEYEVRRLEGGRAGDSSELQRFFCTQRSTGSTEPLEEEAPGTVAARGPRSRPCHETAKAAEGVRVKPRA